MLPKPQEKEDIARELKKNGFPPWELQSLNLAVISAHAYCRFQVSPTSPRTSIRTDTAVKHQYSLHYYLEKLAVTMTTRDKAAKARLTATEFVCATETHEEEDVTQEFNTKGFPSWEPIL